jgi:hypothetical protein
LVDAAAEFAEEVLFQQGQMDLQVLGNMLVLSFDKILYEVPLIVLEVIERGENLKENH